MRPSVKTETTIRTNPMMSLTVLCWSFMGYILGNEYRRWIFLTPVLILVATIMGFLVFSGEELEALILNLYFFVLFINTVVRAVDVIVRSDEYVEFLEEFCAIYNEIMNYGDRVMVNIMKEHSKGAHSFTRSNLLLGFFSCAMFWVYPIVAGTRDLPYGIYVKGLNFKDTPNFEIAYTCQVLFTLCGCCMYMPFSCLAVSFMKLSIALCQILQHKLNNIAENSSVMDNGKLDHDVIERKLVHCINLHNRIILYMRKCNFLLSTVALVELLTFGLLICALLFLCNIVVKVEQLLVALCYIVLVMVQLFMLYWNSNMIVVESLKVCEAIYDTPWYEFNVRNRKLVLLILRRAQTPEKIMLGTFSPITMEVFQKICNMSYTFFTVLRRIYRK